MWGGGGGGGGGGGVLDSVAYFMLSWSHLEFFPDFGGNKTEMPF